MEGSWKGEEGGGEVGRLRGIRGSCDWQLSAHHLENSVVREGESVCWW